MALAYPDCIRRRFCSGSCASITRSAIPPCGTDRRLPEEFLDSFVRGGDAEAKEAERLLLENIPGKVRVKT